MISKCWEEVCHLIDCLGSLRDQTPKQTRVKREVQEDIAWSMKAKEIPKEERPFYVFTHVIGIADYTPAKKKKSGGEQQRSFVRQILLKPECTRWLPLIRPRKQIEAQSVLKKCADDFQ